MRTAIRRAAQYAALAGLSAIASLAIAELALRFLLPQPLLHDPDAFLPDPSLGGRLKPGFSDRVVTTEFSCRWEINADGHRGPRLGERGLRGPVVAAIGDSFTFGYGVEEEEAWPRLLEGQIQAEILNLGVGGYGTWQELGDLERRWDAIRPEIVLAAFYPGNDLSDNLRGYAARTRPATGGDAVPGTTPSDRERMKRWLGSRLHLYSLVSTRADEMLVRLGLRQVVYPSEMEVLIDPAPREVLEGWEATARALASLSRLATERGARAAVILVPMKHQVSDSFRERATRYYESIASRAGNGPPRFDRDAPRRRLAALCADAGLPMLDLGPGLSAPAGGDAGRHYWPRDQHFNGSGHREAARQIAGWLVQLGWAEPN